MSEEPMSMDGPTEDWEHSLPDDLRELDERLSRLGRVERESASPGFEARLIGAVGEVLTPDPIQLSQTTTLAGRRYQKLALAAAVMMVASVGVVMWNSAGFSGASVEATGGVVILEVAIADDVDLLLELVETDYGAQDDVMGMSFGAQVDELALDVLKLDTELDPSWGSLETWVDSFAEGAI